MGPIGGTVERRARWYAMALGVFVVFVGMAFPMLARAADTSCGGVACEESVCARTDVFSCSDWNNGNYDGWSISALYSPVQGDLAPNVGVAGSRGWQLLTVPGKEDGRHFTRSIPSTNAVSARFYIKFSANWHHTMDCGLHKLFYFWSQNHTHREMLGVRRASFYNSRLGGYAGGPGAAGLPDTVGVFAFDYNTTSDLHNEMWPNKAGDRPVLIYPNVWYAVEMRVQVAPTKQVQLWVTPENGSPTLQMTRTSFVVPAGMPAAGEAWTSNEPYTSVQQTSWYGGGDACADAPANQYTYQDNTVLAIEYIGPAAGGASDADADGIPDALDKCMLDSRNATNPCDSDRDGYANVCDGDFDQSGGANASDFSRFFVPALANGKPTSRGTDMNCSGVVNSADYGMFFAPQLSVGRPGPSGLACAGAVPCD
jgi:hypothetical protein